MIRLFAMAAAASVATCSVAPAQAAVNARQLNQERNIEAGERSGKLTPREARNLKQEIRAIERNKRLYTRDGRYSNREKRMIRSQQDALANRIDRLKANGRRA